MAAVRKAFLNAPGIRVSVNPSSIVKSGVTNMSERSVSKNAISWRVSRACSATARSMATPCAIFLPFTAANCFGLSKNAVSARRSASNSASIRRSRDEPFSTGRRANTSNNGLPGLSNNDIIIVSNATT